MMKAVYKNLVVILSLLFTLSIFGFAYYLYIFPERVANLTHVISLADTDLLSPVMSELYIFSLISLGLGFAVVLLSVFRNNDSNENNVVYIEKFKDKKGQKEGSGAQDKKEEEKDEDIVAMQLEVDKESNPKKKAEKLLSLVANKIEASQASYYVAEKVEGKNMITLFAAYAFVLPESQSLSYEFGEGLAGQVAKEKKLVNISDVPEGYITILSGLGESKPAHLLISPVLDGEKLHGVVEIASFKEISKKQEKFIQEAIKILSPQTGGNIGSEVTEDQ